MRSRLILLTLLAVVVPGLFLGQPICAADDSCGGGGEPAAPDYIPGPEDTYTLEQPFGGKGTIATMGEYIQLVYQFALGIVGIIAVVLIMFGGLRWTAAAGNESVIGEAKEIIVSAITGLAIALLSYMILAFISPQTLSTDVSILKIPLPTACDTPALASIPTTVGLNGGGQACANLMAELVVIANKMRTDSSSPESYCPTCTINVGSAYRTPEQQAPIYECYQRCVQEGYISSDGLTHHKAGAPSGCSYCAKAAPTCCSNHVKGMAVDLYFSVGGAAGMEDLPSGLAGDGANNNGKSGGDVNYNVDCSTRSDPEICAAQQKLYNAMLSTGQFSNYKKEWWHFDYKGSCGTSSTSCTEVTNSDGIKVANNAYCFAQSASGTSMYRYATCAANTPTCPENVGGYAWTVFSVGADCDSTQFSGTPLATPIQTYETKPTCYTATEYDYSTF